MDENVRQIEGWPPHLSAIGKSTKMLLEIFLPNFWNELPMGNHVERGFKKKRAKRKDCFLSIR